MPFQVGDTVNVLQAACLPKREIVKHTGAVLQVIPPTVDRKTPLYVIDGLKMRYSDFVLRHAGDVNSPEANSRLDGLREEDERGDYFPDSGGH